MVKNYYLIKSKFHETYDETLDPVLITADLAALNISLTEYYLNLEILLPALSIKLLLESVPIKEMYILGSHKA